MNAKDKAFMEKFPVKESSIAIDLENFETTVFSIIGGLGWYSLHQSKNDQSLPHQIFTLSP